MVAETAGGAMSDEERYGLRDEDMNRVPFFGGPWDQAVKQLAGTLPDVIAVELARPVSLPDFDRGQTLPESSQRNPRGHYRLAKFYDEGRRSVAYRWEGWPAEYGWRMLRQIPSGVTIEVPEEFLRRGLQDTQSHLWGYIGPHARTYPDGHVEFIGWRTTALRKAQWELVP